MTRKQLNERNARNFSAGPGALPESVLRQLQESIVREPDTGLSVLGISHRSDWFAAVIAETERNIRRLLDLSDRFHVLFLQGGATQQFSMIPKTLMRRDAAPADYLHTGYWSGKSIDAAKDEGRVNVAWSGQACGFSVLPRVDELALSPDAPYFHYVSNETVEGLQFREVVGRDDVPRICDMSSDFLSRPCDAARYSLIYAHAQKNLGPAGVTVVVVRDDLLREPENGVPSFLDYRAHVRSRSILNTPPVFAIYAVMLVTRWLMHEIGGLAHMDAINRQKSELLYGVIDAGARFFRGRAATENRSMMNVTFDLPSRQLERSFLEEAAAAGFSGLEGHRTAGGMRASLYNGVSLEAVQALADFMSDFRTRHAR